MILDTSILSYLLDTAGKFIIPDEPENWTQLVMNCSFYESPVILYLCLVILDTFILSVLHILDIVDKLYTQVSLIYLGTVYENWTQLVYSDLSHVM